MDKKFILILLSNTLIFGVGFAVVIIFSSLYVQCTAILVSIVLSALTSKCILMKYKELNLKEGLFLTNLTHTMRNNLAKISGNAQLIGLNNESKEAENILIEVHHLDKMMMDLLNHSIAIENMELRNEMDISVFLQEECEKFKNVLTDKNFEYNIDKNIIIITNEWNIKVLFSTLIENAAKYSKTMVMCNATSDCISICNDTDLADGTYNDIFKRFKREHSAQIGFGIGLSVAKTIVEHAGMNLTAEVKDGIMYMNISK